MSGNAVNDTYPCAPSTIQTIPAHYPHNVHLDHILGILCVFTLVFGNVGNILALRYFIKKKRDIPTIIYTCVVFVDLNISVLILPVGISLFNARNPVLFNNRVFCNAWALAWLALGRMSVFLGALLSISRVYVLTFPFRRINRNVILVLIPAGFVFHLVGGTIPFWWNSRQYYHSCVASCLAFGGDSMPQVAIKATQVFDYLGIQLPVPVVIVTFIALVYQLQPKESTVTRTDSRGEVDDSRKRATVTVTLLTGEYQIN